MFVKLLETVLPHLRDQVLSTPGDSTTFLKTMTRVAVLRLAKHKVLIVILAIRANEKRGALQRRTGRSELLDFWN